MPEFDPSQPFEKIAQGKAPEFDPSQPFEKVEEPGWGTQALNAVGDVGKFVDAYGGDASTRAAISAAQHGKPMIQAFTGQYGSSADAPTGKQIAMDAGVEDKAFPQEIQSAGRAIKNYTPLGIAYQHLAPQGLKDKIENATQADVAGTAVEMAASPQNLIPAGKPIVEGVFKGAEFLKNALKTGAQTVGLDKALYAAGRGAAKVGSAVTGLPARDIETYAQRAPEIKKLVEDAGGSIPTVADVIRERTQGALKAKRIESNSQISKAIDEASPNKTIDLEPVLGQLDKIRGRLNPNLEIEDIAQIDKITERLGNVVDDSGKVSPQDIQDVVRYLQDKGKPAFPTGNIFQGGTEAQKAAKSGSGAAVDLRNQAVPDAVEPFSKLFRMRQIERNINKNLIKPGTPERSLVAAGSGANERGLENLKELADVTGHDVVGDAELLSAADKFTNPSLIPIDSTGKSGTRLAVGAGLGSAVAHLLGLDPSIGAKVGLAATSPAVLKMGMDTARSIGNVPGAIEKGAKSISQEQFMKAFLALKAAKSAEVGNRKKR